MNARPNPTNPTAPGRFPRYPVERVAYRLSEAAAMLGLPKSTCHDLVRRGILKAVRLCADGPSLAAGARGRRGVLLIPREEIMKLISPATASDPTGK